jgi:hypothetical protein
MAGLLAASSILPSDAAPRAPLTRDYDGIWSVQIITLRGDCNRAYRYPLRIVDGHVLKADNDPVYQIAGAVGRGGAIGVTVSGGGKSATGYGRLSRKYGKGSWRASSGECSGQWTAERRG